MIDNDFKTLVAQEVSKQLDVLFEPQKKHIELLIARLEKLSHKKPPRSSRYLHQND